MKFRTITCFGMGVALVLAAGLLAAAGPEKKSGTASKNVEKKDDGKIVKAELNKPAPSFTLTDSAGKTHTLADYKGRIVVLEWTNPDCPYVVGQYKAKAMPRAYAAARKVSENMVWLAINTTHYNTAEASNKWIEKHKLAYPTLLDTTGTVGRQYGARTTPHMFVIDTEGVLRYQGAFTNNPRGGKDPEEIENYVFQAVQQLANDSAVEPNYVKPWGCSVKYAKK